MNNNSSLIKKTTTSLKWSVFIWQVATLAFYVVLTRLFFTATATTLPIILCIAITVLITTALNFVFVNKWTKNNSFPLGVAYTRLSIVMFFVVGTTTLFLLVFVHKKLSLSDASVRYLWTFATASFANTIAIFIFSYIVRKLPAKMQAGGLSIPIKTKVMAPVMFTLIFVGALVSTVHHKTEREIINDVKEEVSSSFAGEELKNTIVQYADKKVESMAYKTFLLVMLPLILSYILGAFVLRYLLNGLKMMNNKAEELAGEAGDLTAQIDLISNDEIGEIAVSFNAFIDKIHYIVNEIKRSNRVLTKKVDDMASVVQETTERSVNESVSISDSVSNVEEMVASIDEITSAVQQQRSAFSSANVAIDELLKSIFQISDNMNTQGQSISETSAAIEEMISNIVSVAKSVQRADDYSTNLLEEAKTGGDIVDDVIDAILEIEESSSQIIDIIHVIQEIAEQTNLLAMNAAIEAAHAGEQGRGFAVVADEIRKLAENTGDNSKSITGIIKSISKRIQKTVQLATDSGKSLDNILDATNSTATIISEINTANSELETGGKDVLETVKNLTSITGDVKSSVDEQMTNGNVVESQITLLGRITQQIASSMEQSSKGAEDIIRSMEELKSISESNRGGRDELLASVKDLMEEFGKLSRLVYTFSTDEEYTPSNEIEMSHTTEVPQVQEEKVFESVLPTVAPEEEAWDKKMFGEEESFSNDFSSDKE